MPNPRAVRDLADAHVDELAGQDPVVGTMTGLRPGTDRLGGFDPDGLRERQDLAERTLRRLADLGDPDLPEETRCARLLHERLTAQLAVAESGEDQRDVNTMFSPVQRIRSVFTLMPTASEDDWSVIARRMANVPAALSGYRETLATGMRDGLFAAPRQVEAVIGQLADWRDAEGGRGWFAGLAEGAEVPAALRTELDAAAAHAMDAFTDLRCWLADEYLPAADGTPDAVGEQRYRVAARFWLGANPDLDEAYEWAWAEFRSLRAEMAAEAERILPGATVAETMRHLDNHGEIVHGEDAIRDRLQRLMDEAMDRLDGTHFDIPEPVRQVEARIAPAGSAAAPYYTRPTRDFARSGRTWLPTLGRDDFPLWSLVSTWYHEGVPGHHLQLGQWTYLADRMSLYQATVGSMSSCTEGWALYAERLADELGYLDAPARLGYLDAQLLRAIRVVIDIGMHLGKRVPADSPIGAGQVWNHDLAREFLSAHSGREQGFVDSEIVRYLGRPAQAISYKLGERAWLAGRDAARERRGTEFDLKSWHMASLSLGPLGLDDLTAELARL